MKRHAMMLGLLAVGLCGAAFWLLSCTQAVLPGLTAAENAPKGTWTPALGRPPKAGDEYVNPTDGSVLLWIPGGEFLMGSNDGPEDERPEHKVAVGGFWLGKYEVTNRQYARFLKSGRERTPGYWDEEDFNQPDQPVVSVTTYEVEDYCRWAGLRLPTETEWEYAAAGGKQLKYPTATGDISHDLANYMGSGDRDKWADTTSPVGSFPPNPFGLYDICGNAWEWISNSYEPYPGGPPISSGYGLRVMRGGCWHFSDKVCTTHCRHRFASHLRYDFAGFRVALTSPDAREKPPND